VLAKPEFRCGALTQAGNHCQHRAVAETDWWRCSRHADWYENATPAERFRLAELEIEELMSE
jgi:hypothetical protein